MSAYWGMLPIALASAWLLTSAVRRYAIKYDLYDIPNSRSSHRVAIPRAGGVAIAAVFLLLLACLYALQVVSAALTIAMLGAATAIVAVGFVDDYRNVGAGWRLFVHATASVWALSWLGGTASLPVFGTLISSSLALNIAVAVSLVWLINLYNFMDGIDGIASIEGITVCGAAAIIHAVAVPGSDFWILPALLGASLAGFAIWNYPPARIFMGDSGSGFIGIVIGILMIRAAQDLPQLIWSWLALLGVFVVDSGLTLAKRLFRGEKLHIAHRSHAYQRASRYYRSHRLVTNAVAAINLSWLFPWALAIAFGWVDGLVGIICAYLPLVWLAIRFRAGSPDE